MELERSYRWRLEKISEETAGVRSQYFSCLEDRPDFIAGQYITLRLPEILPVEGKAYSIASAPYEPLLRITVRTIGKFSTAINGLRVGDEIETSAPYGFFYPEPEDSTPLVLVSGGIGITPCFSIIKDFCNNNDPRPLHLLYSNQTESDIVFKSEIDELHKVNSNFKATHFITREQTKTPDYQPGRISVERILEHTAYLSAPEFFICGSIPFTRDMWRGLKAVDIKPEHLYTEGFF